MSGVTVMTDFTQRRRTAKLTPLLQILNATPGLIVAFVVAGMVWWIALIMLFFFALGGLGLWLTWRRRIFCINEENELEVTSGVFSRRTRRLRISRLQSVDIMRPLVARLSGYSSVKVEVAGTGDSRVLLSFLRVNDAEALRTEILSRAKNVEQSELISAPGDPLSAPTESWKWQVPNGRLVASLALTSSTYFLIIGTVASVALAIADPFGGTGLIALAIAVGGAGIGLISRFTTLFNFTISTTERGIAISHGLFTTASYTVSPIRIQAISVVQPIAWRPFGWYQVDINVAGMDQGSQKSGPRVLMPVVSQELVFDLLHRVLPTWNLEPDPDWFSADAGARRRFPWQSDRLAVSTTPDLFMVRGGAFTRRLSAAPHARIQSLRVTQGPWERKLGLSRIHADSVPGPIKLVVKGLLSETAVSTALSELDHMFGSRKDQHSESW